MSFQLCSPEEEITDLFCCVSWPERKGCSYPSQTTVYWNWPTVVLFSNSQGYTPVNQNCGHSRLQTAGHGRTWLSIIPFSITTFSCIFPHCRIVPQQSEPEHDIKFYFMSPKALRQRTQTKHLHQLQYTHSLTSLTIFYFFLSPNKSAAPPNQ